MVFTRIWSGIKRSFYLAFGFSTTEDDEDGGCSDPNANNCAATVGFRRQIHQAPSSPKRKRPRLATKDQKDQSDFNYTALVPLRHLLTCSVCFEFSKQANQCSNGHLICLHCSSRLEQVAFASNDMKSVCACPICRVSLKNNHEGVGMQRCLLAEKLAAELPVKCRYCEILRPRKQIEVHQKSLCLLRPVNCRNAWLGCAWKGYQQELDSHEENCPILQLSSSNLLKDMNTRLKSLLSCAVVRLHPWRGLQQILEDRQKVRFGKRFNNGLRVILLSVNLERVQGEGSNVCLKSSCVCMPLAKKKSLWVTMSIEKNQSEGTCNQSGYIIYKIILQISSSRPYFLRSECKDNQLKDPIYFSLLSLKCDSPQGCEEGVDITDSWHRYIASIPSTGNENGNSETVPNLTATHTNSSHQASSILSTVEDPNAHRISVLCDRELDQILSGIFNRNEGVDWISPEVLSTRDNAQAVLAFALDPHYFYRKRKKTSTSTQQENSENTDEAVVEVDSSNSSDDEAIILEVDSDDDVTTLDGDDDETLFLLADNIRQETESDVEAPTQSSNGSADVAVSSELED